MRCLVLVLGAMFANLAMIVWLFYSAEKCGPRAGLVVNIVDVLVPGSFSDTPISGQVLCPGRRASASSLTLDEHVDATDDNRLHPESLQIHVALQQGGEERGLINELKEDNDRALVRVQRLHSAINNIVSERKLAPSGTSASVASATSVKSPPSSEQEGGMRAVGTMQTQMFAAMQKGKQGSLASAANVEGPEYDTGRHAAIDMNDAGLRKKISAGARIFRSSIGKVLAAQNIVNSHALSKLLERRGGQFLAAGKSQLDQKTRPGFPQQVAAVNTFHKDAVAAGARATGYNARGFESRVEQVLSKLNEEQRAQKGPDKTTGTT